MRELQELKQDKAEIIDVKPVKKELKYLGSIKPKKGHTVFELNLKTGAIIPAVFESVDAVYSKVIKGEVQVRKKLIVKEHCLYAAALNKTNAVKHFKRMFA